MCGFDMDVILDSGDVTVPQHFLNGAQIAAS